MAVDWGYVKKTTLWHYEPLIEKLQEVLDYAFVKQHYRHTMEEAAGFAQRLSQGYMQNSQPADFPNRIATHFQELGGLGVQDYQDLVHRVGTLAGCEAFIQATGFKFQALIDALNYLLRWALPFKCRLVEVVDTASETELAAADALKVPRIRSNLDLIENGRSKEGRQALAKMAGIPEVLLLKLAHRADMTRLAYVRGKTVLHLCGGGYDSIDKLAAADMEKIEADMSAYYQTLGKTFSDYKAIIPLDWMVGGARVLPRVIEA